MIRDKTPSLLAQRRGGAGLIQQRRGLSMPPQTPIKKQEVKKATKERMAPPESFDYELEMSTYRPVSMRTEQLFQMAPERFRDDPRFVGRFPEERYSWKPYLP